MRTISVWIVPATGLATQPSAAVRQASDLPIVRQCVSDAYRVRVAKPELTSALPTLELAHGQAGWGPVVLDDGARGTVLKVARETFRFLAGKHYPLYVVGVLKTELWQPDCPTPGKDGQ